MKILFITKDFLIEPLGTLYLSSALKKAGHETDILKADIENVREKFETFSPDIVAYSITTGQHKLFADFNLKLKKRKNFVSVFGGPHPTFFNEFINEPGVDIICIGEGEQAMVDLANNIEQGKNITKIPNLWIKNKDKIIKNSVRPLVADLDSLEFPDRELIYDKYIKSYNHPVKNFMWSRGCPYNCPYCFNHSLKKIYKNKGQYLRFRSLDNLLEEILFVKQQYPLEMVYIQDDTFAFQEDQVKEFSQKYPKLINLPFHCHLRANLVNKKIIKLLKKAGCYGVSFGIEAGNDFLRNQILNRNMTKEEIINAARIIKQAGIKFRTFNILGLPQGSLKADLETLKLNIDCKPDLGWACIYQPYPRTELGDLSASMGIYNGDIDEISETFFEESVLDIKNKKQINNLQKLFSLAVSYPFLLPLVKILINMPPNILFKKVYSFWKQRLSKKIYHVDN